MRHRQLPVPEEPDFLAPAERLAVERTFQDYLVCGGFPEVLNVDTHTRHALLRDVMDRHSISNVTALRWLVRHLLGNAAGMFSVERFYAALKSQGLRTSKDSLHDDLAHLEDCFLVRTVWVEAGSERQRMVNPRKALPVNPGLIPVFDRTGRANLGHALETVVLVELERRRIEVTYVRTPSGYEVDFPARKPSERPVLIQVCADLGTSETTERELRALEDLAKTFPKATRRLLTQTRDAMPGDVPKDVIVQPAYEWLLME